MWEVYLNEDPKKKYLKFCVYSGDGRSSYCTSFEKGLRDWIADLPRYHGNGSMVKSKLLIPLEIL